MLNSPDKENTLVGMTCIEQANFKKNLCLILFLFKESDLPADQWEELSPKTYKKILGVIGKRNTFVTFKLIFDKMLLDNRPDTEDVAFYIEKFTNFLIDMVNSGDRFPKIEKLEIKLKDVDHENRTVSKD